MARKFLAVSSAVVAAVTVALGWKAFTRPSKADRGMEVETRDPLLFDDVDADRFVVSLSEAITYPTVVFDDGEYDVDVFDDLHSMLAERYPRIHADLERETFNRHGLLYTWIGSDPSLDPIVLMGHQDVVPVEEGTEDDWSAPPFAGAVVDGRIYGRGALDCKGPLIALFEAIEYLLEHGAEPQRTIHIVSGHDEEIGGANGAATIAAELEARGVTPWLVLDEGGSITDGLIPGIDAPVALVGIAEKGSMELKLTARGRGGHSSMPPTGTAIVRLADAIVAIEAHPVPARIEAVAPMLRALSGHLPGIAGRLAAKPSAAAFLLSRAFARDERLDALQRSTMVPTVVEGGMKSNVIPQTASAIVNIRIIPGDTSSSVLDHVRSVVDGAVDMEILSETLQEPSGFSSIDSEAWQTLTGVIRDVFPSAVIAPWVVTGGTDSRFFAPFSGDVYRFSPFVLDGEGISGFHGTNEFVHADGAKQAVSFFVRLIAVATRPGDSP